MRPARPPTCPSASRAGCRLRCNIAKDEVLRYADVELPAGRLIDRLRDEQEAAFALALPTAA